jgi:hypothetical protein
VKDNILQEIKKNAKRVSDQEKQSAPVPASREMKYFPPIVKAGM